MIVEVDLRKLPNLTLIKKEETGRMINGPVANGHRRSSPTMHVIEAAEAVCDKCEGIVILLELSACLSHCSGNSKQVIWRRRAMPDIRNLAILTTNIEV